MSNSKYFRIVMHYLAAGMTGLVFLVVVFTGIVYYLAVSDQQRVPELVERTCREQLGAEATFSHYRFQYLDYFPFLSLALEDVRMRDPAFKEHGRQLLQVDKVSVLFRPWKIFNGEFVVKTIVIEGAKIELYRATDGYSNSNFLDSLVNRIADGSSDTPSIFSIDKVNIAGLTFDFLDSLRGKHHCFDIRNSQIAFDRQLDTNFLHIQGGWFFRGLTFKFKNGPFLHNKKATIDLRVAAVRKDHHIELQPSTLDIAGNLFQVQGFIKPRAAGYLKLDFRSPGLLLSDARQLLAANLRKALAPYAVDRPIRTQFVLEGPMSPGQPQPIDLKFSVEDATFASAALRFTGVGFEGRYINNCDSSGVITPHTDCLTIDNFSGRLFDRFPFQGSYRAHDLQNPRVKVEGSGEVPLKKLGRFFPPEPFELHSGQAAVEFSYEGTPKELTDPSVRRLHMQLEGRAKIRNASLSYLPNTMRFDQVFADLHFDEEDLELKGFRFHLNHTPYEVEGILEDFLPLVFEKENHLQAHLDVQTPHLQFDHFIKAAPASVARPKKTASPGPDAQIAPQVAGIVQRISDALEVSLRIQAGEVSYRKMGASDVQLRARIPRVCRNDSGERGDCLIIDRLSARIYDDIPVKGSFRLSGLKDPQLRMDLQVQSPLKRFARLVPADKLAIKAGHMSLKLHYQGSLDHYFEPDEALLGSSLRGEVQLEDAALDYLPEDYRLRNLHARFSFNENDLEIDTLTLLVNQNDIRAKGTVVRFLPFLITKSRKLQAELELQTPKLNLNAFLAEKSKPALRRSTPAAATPIAEVIDAAISHITGQLRVRADTLQYQNIRLTKVAFDSRFADACEGQQNSKGCLFFETLSARLFGSAPLEASLTVYDFDNPYFEINGQIAMPLPDLNRMFSSDQFQFRKGWMDVGFQYKGHIRNQKNSENALLNAQFSGQAHITGADFDFKPRGYRFREVEADFAFDEKDLRINRLQLRLNDNAIRASGKFFDFMSFVLLPDRPLQTTLNIYGPHFDFGNFQPPQKHAGASQPADYEATPVTEVVNAALAKMETDLEIHFDTVRHRRFLAREVAGKLLMNADRVKFEKATMKLAGGSFQLIGSITNLQRNQPCIDVRGGFQQADIRDIFQAFENFGQQELTHNNIRGRMTADITFQAQADENYDLLPSSMKGHFDLKVVDGELIRLPALMSMNGFIFKNRNMDAVKFATLENTFDLDGQDLFIDQFFVVSNVITFGVEGTYSLGSEKDTDLLFEVPLANLFHRDFDIKAMDGIEDRLRGISILLRATEAEEGDLKFKLVFSRKRE